MKISDPGVSIPRPVLPAPGPRSNAGVSFSSALASRAGASGPGSTEQPMLLGTITKETPTVSQLLYKSPLKNQCWQIIHDQANTGKPFHRIQPGTQIHYNPETKELIWGKELEAMLARAKPAPQAPPVMPEPAAKAPLQAQAVAGDPAMPEPAAAGKELHFPLMDLSDTAKQFIGRDYNQMDCYELLVGGLKELGVQYGGKGGLHEHLVNQASSQGLAKNHYLTGEGLVSASGTDVFKKTYYKITDPAGTVEELMADLAPKLEQGQILSFSMKNRGHTGVISKLDNQWTFINSGRMDNNLVGENGRKAVGEESLEAELLNWFKLVNKEKQALQISLGSLDMDRLTMFKPNVLSQKA